MDGKHIFGENLLFEKMGHFLFSKHAARKIINGSDNPMQIKTNICNETLMARKLLMG